MANHNLALQDETEAPESGDDFVDDCLDEEEEEGEDKQRLSRRLEFMFIALSSFSLFSEHSLLKFSLLEDFLGVEEFFEILLRMNSDL